MSEQRARDLIASATNLIERMLSAQENDDETEIITFTSRGTDVEVTLNRDVLIFSL